MCGGRICWPTLCNGVGRASTTGVMACGEGMQCRGANFWTLTLSRKVGRAGVFGRTRQASSLHEHDNNRALFVVIWLGIFTSLYLFTDVARIVANLLLLLKLGTNVVQVSSEQLSALDVVALI
jgi:hypothetical protein